MLYTQLHVKYRAVSCCYAFQSLIHLFLWQLCSLRNQPYFWTVRLVRLSAGIQLPEKTEMVHLTSLMLSNKSSSWENLPKHTKYHWSDDRTWQNTLDVTNLRKYTLMSLIRGVYSWGSVMKCDFLILAGGFIFWAIQPDSMIQFDCSKNTNTEKCKNH